ncbi:unnamed protein product [Cyprideis torosa]|uniref:Uncharacterized protein n=1 Tax=Cyprideis torosa TaxID=163714 RepID=A0A7R8WK50_9CRUS|nr:unnamed protein product [Cyprideis torosa]CAG0896542.1 unnamed protein product [Cyprideis torosa]
MFLLLQVLFLGLSVDAVRSYSDDYLQHVCNDSRPYTFDDFIDVAMSLQRVMEFIHSQKERMFLDLQLGTRLAEAQLEALVLYTRDLATRFPGSAEIQQALDIVERLLEKTAMTAATAEPYTMGNEGMEKQDVGFLFLDPDVMTNTRMLRRLDLTKTTRFPHQRLLEIKEKYELSDNEIEILGIELSLDYFEESLDFTAMSFYEILYDTLSANFWGEQKLYTCDKFSKDQLDELFVADTKGYHTTHIVLYLLFADGSGCRKALDAYLKDTPLRSFEGAINDYCADVYREVVGWANPCDHQRVKRTEKVMEHACLGHMTAVILSALPGTLRLILEQAVGTISGEHSAQYDGYAAGFPEHKEYPRVPMEIN